MERPDVVLLLGGDRAAGLGTDALATEIGRMPDRHSGSLRVLSSCRSKQDEKQIRKDGREDIVLPLS